MWGVRRERNADGSPAFLGNAFHEEKQAGFDTFLLNPTLFFFPTARILSCKVFNQP